MGRRKGSSALAAALASRGLVPTLRWGPGEERRAQELRDLFEGSLVLAPATTPASTARLAARAALFVRRRQRAHAPRRRRGVPTLALFGPRIRRGSARSAAQPPSFAYLGTTTIRAGDWGPARCGLRGDRPASRLSGGVSGAGSARARGAPRRGVGGFALLDAPIADREVPSEGPASSRSLPVRRNARLHGRLAPDRGGRDDALGPPDGLAGRRPDPPPPPDRRLERVRVEVLPVNTRYETWVDARDFQPLRFEKRAREGRYVSDEVEEFDLVRRVGSWRTDRTPLPERVTDIISSFYFMRSSP